MSSQIERRPPHIPLYLYLPRCTVIPRLREKGFHPGFLGRSSSIGAILQSRQLSAVSRGSHSHATARGAVLQARLFPTIVVYSAGFTSFYFLSAAVERIPIGAAHAVWTGIGAIGTALIGMVLFHEPAYWLWQASQLCSWESQACVCAGSSEQLCKTRDPTTQNSSLFSQRRSAEIKLSRRCYTAAPQEGKDRRRQTWQR